METDYEKLWAETFLYSIENKKVFEELTREYMNYKEWVQQVADELYTLSIALEEEPDPTQWDLTHRLLKQLREV